ncbi:putative heat shock protein [Candidatus Methylobacter favarea]|uniref:Heat shock protein HspQ n=1 Tax=Candidatus Methylobacter favarea TaxID=2707345 RepID=A0A8S0X9C9_9GAMM|nr:heat shock protein HspQ [Candidatus Methylobacter favarea]CAA9892126.1 putative heat shock protein [Candidatus Methylobacter favarea]
MQKANFFIGQIIYHKLFDYRGVIFDADFQFLGSQDWYDKIARSRPSKNQPWYHVLVDNATHHTYIAESNLEPSKIITPINHPWIDRYFEQLEDGVYQLKTRKN